MRLMARDVAVRYPGQAGRALDGVNLSVRDGEMVAVVGPNGGGKTTLLRALLGLVPLERGEALLDGRPVGSYRREEIARRVGVVSQREETVFPLRAEELVTLGRYAHLGPLAPVGEADRDAVRQAMVRCDVWQLRDRRVDTLSGGEWQRVRVARALAQEPRALVLDEPTAALDVRYEMEVFELVHQLAQDGLAVLCVTHHLNLAARYADRLVLLAGGRVVAEGTPGEVLTAEVVSRVFGWPVAVTAWCDGSPQVVPLRPDEVMP
ncbi:MAG: ABC transporter ATP-binding protein [Gemmatimonadota bacterium]